jgi:hypothetical protein
VLPLKCIVIYQGCHVSHYDVAAVEQHAHIIGATFTNFTKLTRGPSTWVGLVNVPPIGTHPVAAILAPNGVRVYSQAMGHIRARSRA